MTITNKMTMELFLDVIETNPDLVLEQAKACQNMPTEITIEEIKEKTLKMIKSYSSKSKNVGPTTTYRENEQMARALAQSMTDDMLVNSTYVCEKFGLQHKQKATSILNIAIDLGLLEKAPKIKGVSLIQYRLTGSTVGNPEPAEE